MTTRPELSHEVLEAWLQCERRAWLACHRPELRSEESGLEQYLREQRADIARAYRRRLSRAVGSAAVADGAGGDGPLRAVAQGARAVLGGALATDGAGPPAGWTLRAPIDALRRLRNGWGIVAIAAGTRVRPHHLRRLAFQRLVADANGLPVRTCSVAHVDRRASAQQGFLRVQDVTAATREAALRLPLRLRALGASLASAREPRTVVGGHCHRPRACPFLEHCWAPYGGRSIFQVAELSGGTRQALRSAGWLDVRQVPSDAPGFRAAERRALADARAGRARVDFTALRSALAALARPAAYLDMEFATPAVPWLPGMTPFQPLPFQFSVHLEGGDGHVRHVSFLHREPDRDPRPGLAAALAEALAGAESVIVYDASSETALLEELAALAPGTAASLRRAAQRSWDLLAVVRATVRHPGFGGGWGLKRVADTLAPGSYDGVELPDGLAAQAVWRRLLRDRDGRAETLLRRYCEADSRALLRVVRALRHWARAGTPRG